MTKEELVKRLKEIASNGNDAEYNHIDADDLLIEFINDPIVTEVYNSITKWYT